MSGGPEFTPWDEWLFPEPKVSESCQSFLHRYTAEMEQLPETNNFTPRDLVELMWEEHQMLLENVSTKFCRLDFMFILAKTWILRGNAFPGSWRFSCSREQWLAGRQVLAARAGVASPWNWALFIFLFSLLCISFLERDTCQNFLSQIVAGWMAMFLKKKFWGVTDLVSRVRHCACGVYVCVCVLAALVRGAPLPWIPSNIWTVMPVQSTLLKIKLCTVSVFTDTQQTLDVANSLYHAIWAITATSTMDELQDFKLPTTCSEISRRSQAGLQTTFLTTNFTTDDDVWWNNAAEPHSLCFHSAPLRCGKASQDPHPRCHHWQVDLYQERPPLSLQRDVGLLRKRRLPRLSTLSTTKGNSSTSQGSRRTNSYTASSRSTPESPACHSSQASLVRCHYGDRWVWTGWSWATRSVEQASNVKQLSEDMLLCWKRRQSSHEQGNGCGPQDNASC